MRVVAEALGEDEAPIVITQSEYMRRMKDVANLQQGMAFYGEMPDMYNVVLNADHRLIKQTVNNLKRDVLPSLEPIEAELKGLNARHAAIEQKLRDKKPDEITDDDKKEQSDCHAAMDAEREKKQKIFADYAADDKVAAQLIDLALLQNGLLKGAALNAFLKRSVDLM